MTYNLTEALKKVKHGLWQLSQGTTGFEEASVFSNYVVGKAKELLSILEAIPKKEDIQPVPSALEFAKWLEENTTVIKEEKITLYRYYSNHDGWGNYTLDDIYTEFMDKYEGEDIQPVKMGMGKLRNLLNQFDGEEISMSKLLEEINNHFLKPKQ